MAPLQRYVQSNVVPMVVIYYLKRKKKSSEKSYYKHTLSSRLKKTKESDSINDFFLRRNISRLYHLDTTSVINVMGLQSTGNAFLTFMTPNIRG